MVHFYLLSKKCIFVCFQAGEHSSIKDAEAARTLSQDQINKVAEKEMQDQKATDTEQTLTLMDSRPDTSTTEKTSTMGMTTSKSLSDEEARLAEVEAALFGRW